MLRFFSFLLPALFFAPDDPGGDPADPTPDPAPDPTPDPGDPAQLGDAGKRALDAERTARATAEKTTRDALAEKKKLEDELATFRDANKSETEKLIEKAREEADKAARIELETKYELQLLESRVLVRAAGKLASPQLTVKLIDLDSLAKGDDGKIEDKAIDAAIADLVKQEPNLAAGAKPGPGDPDGGRRGNGAAQLTQADLKGMTSAQIVEAKAKGQLDGLLGRTS